MVIPTQTSSDPTPDAFFWPGEIIPKPKRAVYSRRAIILTPTDDGRPVCAIILGYQATAPEVEAAAELKLCIQALDANIRPAILKGETPPATVLTIIVIGTSTSNEQVKTICRRLKLKLTPTDPGREGYRIRFLASGRQTIILCGGSDPTGCYFGVQSLKQLCAVRHGQVVIRPAAVDDYPTFPFRGMNINSPEACRYFMAAKLNGWVVNQYHLLHRWKAPPAPYRAYLRRLCRAAPRHGTGVLQIINPLRSQNGGYGGADKIRCSSEADIKRLYQTMCLSLKGGSRMVMLAFDDHASRLGGPASQYILTDPEDRRRFHGDLGRAHAHVSNRIYARLRRDYPGVTLLVCPAYYWLPRGILREPGEDYLRTLGRALPPEVGMVWTGAGVRSPDLRRAHVKRYSALIARKPFFWNNDFNCLHSVAKYVFDPFGAGYFKNLPSFTGHGIMIDSSMEGRGSPGVVAYGAPAKQVMRVALWQMGDYMWNPEGYEPERSLRRAITAVAGPGSVGSLLRFRDTYRELYDRYMFLRNPKTVVPLDGDALQRMRGLIKDLNEQMAEVARRSNNPALTAELRDEWLAPIIKNACTYPARQRMKAKLTKTTEYGLLFPAESFLGHAGNLYAGEAMTSIFSWPYPPYLRTTRAVFILASKPRRDALLSIKGRRDDRITGTVSDAVALRIRINGHLVFRGATEFRPDPLIVLAWHVNRNVFQRGRNVLAIENITTSHQLFHMAWAKLVGIKTDTRKPHDDAKMILQH